jgi:magnesium transporter
MARFLKKTTKEAGLPPGTLVFVGEQRMEEPIIRLMEYDSSNLIEKELTYLDELESSEKQQGVTWMNVDGVHDAEIIEAIGKTFSISPLLLEDVMNTGQRPKMVEYGDHVFITLKMLRLIDGADKIVSQQLSLVIGEGLLITFQEQQGDVFDPVRERIRLGRKRIRSSDSDFLSYSLLDVVCENYLMIIEVLGEKVDDLEEKLLADPRQELLLQINRYKQEITTSGSASDQSGRL